MMLYYCQYNLAFYRYVLLAVADIQELGQVGSYMLDIMDIIISEKEFFNNIVFL